MSDLVERSNMIPSQSFVPLFDFVDELISTDEDEGRVPFEGGKENVGLLIYERYEDKERQNIYKVIKYREEDKVYVIKSVTDPSDTQELGGYDIYDNWGTLPPAHVENRWERYMNKRIGEGVWMDVADAALIAEVNREVDAFAAAEPVDHHPGTNGVVRDLVHPSLYPLIIDPASVKTSETNRWNRPYEQSRFQWLPAEVRIDESGAAKFTSPINNLDADKYPKLRQALEKTFTAMVPGFENVFQYIETAVYDADFQIGDGVDSYEVAPKRSFRNSTLQAVVKVADYEFAPGAVFSGVWHYEGMSHENIAMTGLFYPYTDESLTGGGLEFKRQYTDAEANKLLYGVAQSRPPWLNEVIEEAFVPLGWTSTETGKLMVFPNCHAHRVLEMVNNTSETLRRRLVVFFVVDPDKPIKSSAKYPPLPRQISLEQALKDRLELMQERKQAKQQLNPREIELCEH